MKNCLLILLAYLSASLATFAQHPGPRSYEVTGLPDSKQVMESLPAGIALVVLGIILIAIVVRRKKDNDYSSDSPIEKGMFGCGCLSLIAGGIALIPLLTWVEFGFVSAISVIAIVCGVFLALNWIYNAFKGGK